MLNLLLRIFEIIPLIDSLFWEMFTEQSIIFFDFMKLSLLICYKFQIIYEYNLITVICNYNYNVIMHGINFIQRPTSKAGRVFQSYTWPWWIHVWGEHLSLFLLVSPALMVPGVCCSPSVPSRVFVLHSLLELSIMPSTEEWLFSSPTLAGIQTWASSTTCGRRLTFEGQPLLPHSLGREKGWGHLRGNPGFGVFWFIPPLLSKPIFGQPPL